MKFKNVYLLALAVVAFGLTTACDEIFSDDQYDFSGVVLGEASSGDASTAADRNRIEVPAERAGEVFIAHSTNYIKSPGDTLPIMTYCLAYDTAMMHSRWVAFRFDAVTRQSNTSRSSEPFMDDPKLSSAYYIGSNGFGRNYTDLLGNVRTAGALQPSYSSGQFDRGHLCASADRYLSATANAQTFYMTNMSPQLSAFNQRYWTAFEGFVQSRGRDATFADTLYVVKGGTVAKDQILGYVSRYNGAQVAVPAYYYMALLYCKNNTYGAIGFWMEHKDYGVKNSDEVNISEKVVSIDQLEDLTGIDFFPNLPDVIETAVEANYSLSDWKIN